LQELFQSAQAPRCTTVWRPREKDDGRCSDRCTRLGPAATAVNPAVAPAGVLAGQPEDQGPDVPAGGRPAGLAAHGPGGPAAADDVAVPAQDGVRVTSSRSPCRRAFGITASRVARSARSAQSSLGRRGCRRCSTASWWHRIRISAVFHVSSCRASRSHAASRMVRRNMNRRHMTSDHHGGTAGRATLLARAMDEILGTHRDSVPARGGTSPNRGSITTPR
jgi:hypothetical protein